jgi:hypothetical protein
MWDSVSLSPPPGAEAMFVEETQANSSVQTTSEATFIHKQRQQKKREVQIMILKLHYDA